MALLFWLWFFIPLVLGSLIFTIPALIIFNAIILFSSSIDRFKFEKLCGIFYWTFYINFGLTSIYWLRNTPLLEHGQNLSFVLLLCLATWSNDTFAYFGGKLFGKHPLFKQVSSNKTWEGFLAGSILSIATVLAIKYLPPLWDKDLLFGLSIADILWVLLPSILAAPFGDLIESRFKRLYEIKDSSKLLPGHGGLLDRIDGLLIVAPWTALYVFIIRPLY
jgi:phosphatidate cytidylyltransferase